MSILTLELFLIHHTNNLITTKYDTRDKKTPVIFIGNPV